MNAVERSGPHPVSAGRPHAQTRATARRLRWETMGRTEQSNRVGVGQEFGVASRSMSRVALAAALVVLGGPALAGRSSAKDDQRRKETQELMQQILMGQSVQSAVSKILYMGQEKFAAEAFVEVLSRTGDPRQREHVAFALATFGVKTTEH